MNHVRLYVPQSDKLADNDQWTHRFEIRSETSNRIYIIAQNKKRGHFACSCPGYKRHRKCKHLLAMGLPCHEEPVVIIEK